MVDKMNDDLMLDALFAAAKDDSNAQASPDLMARVLSEAETIQAGFAAPIIATPQMGFWSRLVRALGGWHSISGLAMATVAGVWIGVAAGPGVMQSEFGSAVLFSGDEIYLSALDESYAMLLE